MNPADTAFIILCATFVMLMTPALALFYGGLVRSKNILSTCMHSYAALGMVSILWALFGYSLAFSGDISGLIGNLDHVFLIGVGGEANGPAANLPHNVFMAFQCMFAALTVALISGAYAERIRFSAMLVFSALWTVFVYCPMAHWVWGGGWMAKLGAVDFAGGAVVHMASAAAALACAHTVGPRTDLGKTPIVVSYTAKVVDDAINGDLLRNDAYVRSLEGSSSISTVIGTVVRLVRLQCRQRPGCQRPCGPRPGHHPPGHGRRHLRLDAP